MCFVLGAVEVLIFLGENNETAPSNFFIKLYRKRYLHYNSIKTIEHDDCPQ